MIPFDLATMNPLDLWLISVAVGALVAAATMITYLVKERRRRTDGQIVHMASYWDPDGEL